MMTHPTAALQLLTTSSTNVQKQCHGTVAWPQPAWKVGRENWCGVAAEQPHQNGAMSWYCGVAATDIQASELNEGKCGVAAEHLHQNNARYIDSSNIISHLT